jgi:Ca2+-binding RTX toxin-like protein
MRRAALVLAAMALALLLASGVALAVNKIGTNGPDTLMGTDGNDNLIGRGGNDRLFALNGRDNLLGGRGKDYIDTHPTEFRSGDKNLQGGPGNDIVVGGTGSDNVSDDAGNDFLIDDDVPESSLDKLSGGDGNDVFSVQNAPATKDIVACGGGFDRVVADRNDVLAPDCERVQIVHGSVEEVEDQAAAFFDTVPQSFYNGLQPGALPSKES